MAKSKSQSDVLDAPAETSSGPTAQQIKLAVKVVIACTGCGKIDAESRVGVMGAIKVAKLAALEAAGKRAEAVKLLYDRG